MKNLFISLFVLLISVIAISAQTQDPEQEWVSMGGDSPLMYWCPVINAIVRDYGEWPFQRLSPDADAFLVSLVLSGITQACADRGYTDTLPSPSAGSASPELAAPASDGNVIIELSSATHGEGAILSNPITLTPGLYNYESEGLGKYGYEGRVYVATHREPSYCGFLGGFFDLGNENAGFVDVDRDCDIRIEIRNDGQPWSLRISRVD